MNFIFLSFQYAVSKKCKSTEKKKTHWLDYADDKFDVSILSKSVIIDQVNYYYFISF